MKFITVVGSDIYNSNTVFCFPTDQIQLIYREEEGSLNLHLKGQKCVITILPESEVEFFRQCEITPF